METTTYDGRLAAQIIKNELKTEAERLGLKPNLAVILVGDDPSSLAYIKRKQKACEELSWNFQLLHLPQNVIANEVKQSLSNLNNDPAIHGIVLQLPLPKSLPAQAGPKFGSSPGHLISQINPAKEIDGLSPLSRFTPPTAQAVIYVLTQSKIKILDAKAVVLGRGKTAGAPIAMALKKRGAKVFTANSTTPPEITKRYTLNADIIVSAVGTPNLVTGEMAKPGAVVIGVGMSRVPISHLPLQNPTSNFPPPTSRVVGDIDEQSMIGKASIITPTPGGIGPLTVAFLLKNLLEATKNRQSKFKN